MTRKFLILIVTFIEIEPALLFRNSSDRGRRNTLFFVHSASKSTFARRDKKAERVQISHLLRPGLGTHGIKCSGGQKVRVRNFHLDRLQGCRFNNNDKNIPFGMLIKGRYFQRKYRNYVSWYTLGLFFSKTRSWYAPRIDTLLGFRGTKITQNWYIADFVVKTNVVTPLTLSHFLGQRWDHQSPYHLPLEVVRQKLMKGKPAVVVFST